MRCSEPYGCTRCVRGGTLAKQSNGLAAPPRSRHRTDAQQWCACHWLYRRLSTATPTQRMRSALRQLACCNTLATQTSVAQIGLQRCYGSLRGHPGASGVIQRQRLCRAHGIDASSPARPRGEQKTASRRVPGIVSSRHQIMLQNPGSSVLQDASCGLHSLTKNSPS